MEKIEFTEAGALVAVGDLLPASKLAPDPVDLVFGHGPHDHGPGGKACLTVAQYGLDAPDDPPLIEQREPGDELLRFDAEGLGPGIERPLPRRQVILDEFEEFPVNPVDSLHGEESTPIP